MSLVLGLYFPQLRNFAGVPWICKFPTSSKTSRAALQPHNQPQPGCTHCCSSQRGENLCGCHSHTRGDVIEPPSSQTFPSHPCTFPWVYSLRAGALGGAGLEEPRGYRGTAVPRPRRDGWRRLPVQELGGGTGAGGSRHPGMCNDYPRRLKLSPGARDVPGRTAARARRRMRSTKSGFSSGMEAARPGLPGFKAQPVPPSAATFWDLGAEPSSGLWL